MQMKSAGGVNDILVEGPSNLGKSEMLARRVAAMVALGTSPQSITVLGYLTVTVELISFHLRAIVGDKVDKMEISTVHQYCAETVGGNSRLVEPKLWLMIIGAIAKRTKATMAEVEAELGTSNWGCILRDSGFWRYGDFIESARRANLVKEVVVVDDYQDIPTRYREVVDPILASASTVLIGYNPDYLLYDFVSQKAGPPPVRPMPRLKLKAKANATVSTYPNMMKAISEEVFTHMTPVEDISVICRTNNDVTRVCQELVSNGLHSHLMRFDWQALPLHVFLALLGLRQHFNPADFAVIAGCIDQRRLRLQRVVGILETVDSPPLSIPTPYKSSLPEIMAIGTELVLIASFMQIAVEDSECWLSEVVTRAPRLQLYINSISPQGLRYHIDEFCAHISTTSNRGRLSEWFLRNGNDVTRQRQPRFIRVSTGFMGPASPVAVVSSDVGGKLLRHLVSRYPRVLKLR